MLYLWDSNVCIVFLNQRSAILRQRLASVNTSDIAVCSVVKAELFYGAMRSNNPFQNLAKQMEFFSLFVSLPFDDKSALIYGNIRAKLANLGTPIGMNDLQIASIALAHNLTLVTHNVGEFSRVDGLRIEDWQV